MKQFLACSTVTHKIYIEKWFKNCWSLKILFQREFLKVLRVSAFLIWRGSLFHSREAVTVKVLPPSVFRFTRGQAILNLAYLVCREWVSPVSTNKLVYSSVIRQTCICFALLIPPSWTKLLTKLSFKNSVKVCSNYNQLSFKEPPRGDGLRKAVVPKTSKLLKSKAPNI